MLGDATVKAIDTATSRADSRAVALASNGALAFRTHLNTELQNQLTEAGTTAITALGSAASSDMSPGNTGPELLTIGNTVPENAGFKNWLIKVSDRDNSTTSNLPLYERLYSCLLYTSDAADE